MQQQIATFTFCLVLAAIICMAVGVMVIGFLTRSRMAMSAERIPSRRAQRRAR